MPAPSPTYRAILLRRLRVRPGATAADLAVSLRSNTNTVYHALRMLRTSGLVRVDPGTFPRRHYRTRPS